MMPQKLQKKSKTQKEIDKIDAQIGKLHHLKASHRKGASTVIFEAYYEMGMPHCGLCAAWTDEQNILRARRKVLMINASNMKKMGNDK